MTLSLRARAGCAQCSFVTVQLRTVLDMYLKHLHFVQTAELDRLLTDAFLNPISPEVTDFFFPGTVCCLQSS